MGVGHDVGIDQRHHERAQAEGKDERSIAAAHTGGHDDPQHADEGHGAQDRGPLRHLAEEDGVA